MLVLPILSIIISLYFIFKKKERHHSEIIYVSKDLLIVNKQMIDLKHRLTPEQEFHNRVVDFEIDEARRDNEHRDKMNALKIEQWNHFLELNPDHKWKSCPNLDMTSNRKIIAIKYV